MPYLRQRSFAGGELDPSLHARTDIAKYQTGAKTMRNFMVRKSGGFANRAGSHFFSETLTNSKARLIEFKITGNLSLLLEFTHLKIRIFRGGEIVRNLSNVIVEITSPYTEAQIREIDYTQSIDVMTIVHPSHIPKELKILIYPYSMTLTDIVYAPDALLAANLTANQIGTGGSAWYEYSITSLNANGEESVVGGYAYVGPSANTTLSRTNPIRLVWDTLAANTTYCIYRIDEFNDTPGLIGICTITLMGAGKGIFHDIGVTPDYTKPPSKMKLPFNATNKYPSCVAYAQQRIFYGNTNTNKETVWGSKIGGYNRFNDRAPFEVIKDDDSVEFNLAGEKINPIRYILDIGGLVMFTDNSEWAIGKEGALSPTNLNAKQYSYNGCKKGLKPIAINDTALYVQKSGSVIRELGFTYESDGYRGDDLTTFSAHLFDGKAIVDWDYQQTPDSIVWVVLDDGTIAALTHIKEQGIIAWHRHDFFDGFVESVCCVEENAYEYVYLVIRRVVGGVTKRYVERLNQRSFKGYENEVFMDASTTINGKNLTATTITISGGTLWDPTEELTLTASTSYFVGGDVGTEIHFDYQGEVRRFQITTYTSGTVVKCFAIAGVVPVSLRNSATTLWSKAIKTITGLGHLEGKKVSVIADGYVKASPNNPQYDVLTVDGASITINQAHVLIHVGLPITSDFESLAIDGAEGLTLATEKKLVRSAAVKMRHTRGGFLGTRLPADGGVSGLNELRPRSVESYEKPSAYMDDLEEVATETAWDRAGAVVLRQVDPLPIEVIAILPQVMLNQR